jgi:hypothetical protein
MQFAGFLLLVENFSLHSGSACATQSLFMQSARQQAFHWRIDNDDPIIWLPFPFGFSRISSLR